MTDVTRERIRQRLEELDYSANFVSEKAGLNRSVLRKYLNEQVKELRTSNLEAIADVLRCDAAYLRGDIDSIYPRDIVSSQLLPIASTSDVPIVGIVEAGAFRPVDEVADVLGVIVNGFDPNFAGVRQFGYEVHGDSMDLVGISHGDQVVCIDPWEAGVEIGDEDWVVVEHRHFGGHAKELTIKQLKIFNDRFELTPRSSNPKHQPIVVPRDYDLGDDHEVRIVGIVIKVIKTRPVKWSVRGKRTIQSAAKSASKVKKSIQTGFIAVLASAGIGGPCYACEDWASPIRETGPLPYNAAGVVQSVGFKVLRERMAVVETLNPLEASMLPREIK